MVDEELGIVLSLKDKQQMLAGLDQVKSQISSLGQSTTDAGNKATVAAGKTGVFSKKIDGIAAASKRSGKIAGAMFGVIVANSQGALGPIAEVQSKLMGVGNVLDDTKNKAAKWTIGVGAALTGVGAVLGTIVSKEQTAGHQLEAAIAGAGGSVEKFQGRINAAIKTGEHYGDTSARTMSALNRLVLATHNPQQAFKLYNSVLQISAARHQDVEEIALQVGRALHGQARSLQGYGIELSSTTKLQGAATAAQKKHESALAAVKKAQQGLKDEQARLNASTSSGTSSTTALASARLTLSSAQAALNKTVFNYGPASSEAALAQQRVSLASQKYTDTLHKANTAGGLSVSQQITLRNAHDRLAAAQKKLKQSTHEAAAAQHDLAKNGDVSNQIIKQTAKYMGGQASAQANTFTGKMHMLAAVIDDHVATSASHFYKYLVTLGPALMGVGAIMETGIVGKTYRGTKALLGFANAEGVVSKWSIKNMVTQIASGAKVAAIWVFQTAKLVAFKVAEYAVTAATKAYTAAQWLLNAAMDANPLAIVIGLVIVLAAGFVLLWKRSSTFRHIVTGAFGAVEGAAKSVWGWLKKNWPYLLPILLGPFGIVVGLIIKHWDKVLGFFKAIPGKIGSLASGIADAFMGPFDWVFNKIAWLWNNTVGRISFHTPHWIPHFGGKGFSMPKIPEMHTGTYGVNSAAATSANIGPIGGSMHTGGVTAADMYYNIQPSEEIVHLPNGTTVLPVEHPALADVLTPREGNEAPHVIQVVLNGKVVAEAVHQNDRDEAARL
jgi:hypothetical protein